MFIPGITTVLFYVAVGHSMQILGWMRPPAPRQMVLARDKPDAKHVLSAVPVPGIETTVQKFLYAWCCPSSSRWYPLWWVVITVKCVGRWEAIPWHAVVPKDIVLFFLNATLPRFFPFWEIRCSERDTEIRSTRGWNGALFL